MTTWEPKEEKSSTFHQIEIPANVPPIVDGTPCYFYPFYTENPFRLRTRIYLFMWRVLHKQKGRLM